MSSSSNPLWKVARERIVNYDYVVADTLDGLREIMQDRLKDAPNRSQPLGAPFFIRDDDYWCQIVVQYGMVEVE